MVMGHAGAVAAVQRSKAYIVGPSAGGACEQQARKSDLFLPSRFRKANQLPLTVKPQTYQPNTFLKVLFEAVSTSY